MRTESPRRSYRATVAATDRDHDLALLRLADAGGLLTGLEVCDPADVEPSIFDAWSARWHGDRLELVPALVIDTRDCWWEVDGPGEPGRSGGPLTDTLNAKE